MSLVNRRKEFGLWLRSCRKQARITQSELAKTLGYDSSQLISNIERGVSLLPSKRIPDFARALGGSLLEMEVRYFQCSARNTSESRMPDLLLKYLPLIELMEYGSATHTELLKTIDAIKNGTAQKSQADGTSSEDEDSDASDAPRGEDTAANSPS
ncbi:MAG: helix-turn-helix domain-containing protein [Bdellovibrionaceae bacterium]|nr:helix-turn-helix domain-containing protein [Pseudobdellovibrionaceae bacterium]